MVIIFFTMTAAVATSIVRCVMVLFASGKTGLLNIVMAAVVVFSYFCFDHESLHFRRIEDCC